MTRHFICAASHPVHAKMYNNNRKRSYMATEKTVLKGQIYRKNIFLQQALGTNSRTMEYTVVEPH